MRYKLMIGCVDGSSMKLDTIDKDFVKDFLAKQDHEGSSIVLQVQYEYDEAYKFLEINR